MKAWYKRFSIFTIAASSGYSLACSTNALIDYELKFLISIIRGFLSALNFGFFILWTSDTSSLKDGRGIFLPSEPFNCVVNIEFSPAAKKHQSRSYCSTGDYYSRCSSQDKPNKKRHEPKLRQHCYSFQGILQVGLGSKLAPGATKSQHSATPERLFPGFLIEVCFYFSHKIIF